MQGAALPNDLLSISMGKLAYLFADLKSKVGRCELGFCFASCFFFSLAAFTDPDLILILSN